MTYEVTLSLFVSQISAYSTRPVMQIAVSLQIVATPSSFHFSTRIVFLIVIDHRRFGENNNPEPHINESRMKLYVGPLYLNGRNHRDRKGEEISPMQNTNQLHANTV